MNSKFYCKSLFRYLSENLLNKLERMFWTLQSKSFMSLLLKLLLSAGPEHCLAADEAHLGGNVQYKSPNNGSIV